MKKWRRSLKEFTTAIARDKEMADFAKGKNVVFTFTVKDLDQTFFMSFVDGKVDAGLDNPPREPDVKLKMSADTLDGMFTGRVNATKAATSGKLSFSGDTGKAMSFIRIQGDMGKLYTAGHAQRSATRAILAARFGVCCCAGSHLQQRPLNTQQQ